MKLSTWQLCSIVAAIILFSCSKKDVEETLATNCRPIKTYVFNGNAIADSFIYTYNNENRLERVTYGNGNYFLLEYYGNKITRRNHYFFGDVRSTQYEAITYNTNGTIKQIDRLNSTQNMIYRKVFTHTSNKLTRIEEFDAANVLQARYNYSYTINNLTKVDGEEFWGGISRSYSIKYHYGTDPNFFKAGEQSLLTDGFFNSQISVSIPYALSDNNVRELEYNGVRIPVTYIYDTNKNVTEVKTDAQSLMRASYECR
jgi:hypothetical protein